MPQARAQAELVVCPHRTVGCGYTRQQALNRRLRRERPHASPPASPCALHPRTHAAHGPRRRPVTPTRMPCRPARAHIWQQGALPPPAAARPQATASRATLEIGSRSGGSLCTPVGWHLFAIQGQMGSLDGARTPLQHAREALLRADLARPDGGGVHFRGRGIREPECLLYKIRSL